MPELEIQIQAMQQGEATAEAVSAWIDTALASYGKDARGLVRDAVTAYLDTERQHADAPERLQALATLENVFFAPNA